MNASTAIRTIAPILLFTSAALAPGLDGGLDKAKLKERMRNLSSSVATLTESDALKPTRNDTTCQQGRAASSAQGKEKGNARFREIAVGAQYAFDKEEAPQILSTYEGETGPDRQKWKEEYARTRTQAEQAIAALAKADQGDDAKIAAVKKALAELTALPGLDDLPGAGKIIKAIDRIDDRADSLAGNYATIRDLEKNERSIHERLGQEEGVVEGATFRQDRWEQIASAFDSDEGPWARHGTDPDKRSPGWGPMTSSQVIAPATESAKSFEGQAAAMRGTLGNVRGSASNLVAQVRDLTVNLQDLIDLILEMKS